MKRVKVDSKGRIVIPRSLREELDIKAGDMLEIWIEDGRIVLSKAANPWSIISDILGKYGVRYEREMRLEAEAQLGRIEESSK